MPSFESSGIRFDDIDATIKKAAIDVGCSYSNLRELILSCSPKGRHRDMYTFRAIFIWLMTNYRWTLIEPEDNSPHSLIKSYQTRKLSMSRVINEISREFKIPSKTIHGHAKQIKADRTYSVVRTTWNAIQLNGNWFLLNTNILFPPVEESILENLELREIVASNRRTKQFRLAFEVDRLQTESIAFDEFWFLTDPKHFIYFCFPDQLSERYVPLRQEMDYNDFLNLPLLHPTFFKYNFDILSGKMDTLLSENGRCAIIMYTDKNIAAAVELSCDFYEIKEDKCYLVTTEVTSEIVCLFRTIDTFTFEFRFKFVGRYRAVIYCQEKENLVRERCCEFEILCDKAYVGPIRKLSPAAAKIGFGAGLEAFDMGIIASSQAYSTICVNHHEREKGYVSDESKAESTTLKFQLVEGACDKFDYRATLTACHSMENAHSQKDVVKLCKTESELKIKVTLPDEGDYILTIYAVDTEREDDPSAHPICCYLISTNMNPQEERERQEMEMKRKKVKRERRLQMKNEEYRQLEEEVKFLKLELRQLKHDNPQVVVDVY